MPTGGIAASLFEAMAVALVKGPEEASVAGTTPESHEQEQTKRDKLCHTDLEHVSLIKADPNAFYGDAACFDHFAARPTFEICAFGERCGHSLASIVCYSCARFDEENGHYCTRCFEAYHPWYRTEHKWTRLEDTEDTEKAMELQAHRTTFERNVADLQGLMQMTSSWWGELDIQDADTKSSLQELIAHRACLSKPWLQGDDLVKEAARDATRVGVKIRDLADMSCEDRTKVSKVAVDEVIRQAVRSQKSFEARDKGSGEAVGVPRGQQYHHGAQK